MKYRKRNVSASSIKIAVALVADYANREAAAKSARAADMNETALEAFERNNRIIDECLECVEPFLRGIIRADIGSGTGWYGSKARKYIAKDVYYARKNQVVHKILKSFNLLLDK